MSHILIITVGPVQPLIAAARKSRDLFMGSDLLSEVSREVAWTLREAGADLIFPSPLKAEDLDPPEGNQLGRAGRFNVANRIVAEVEGDGALAAELARKGSEAARHFLRAQGEMLIPALESETIAHTYLKHLQIRRGAFHAQLAEALEVAAVWEPIPADPTPSAEGGYQLALSRADARMSARKRLRDFGPGDSDFGFPKSALDGRSDSVLERPRRPHPGARPERAEIVKRRRAGLKPAEALDAIGLLKRVHGEPERFLPLSRLAVDPWLRAHYGSDGAFRSALAKLANALDEGLRAQRQEPIPGGILEGFVSRVKLKNRRHFDPFLFDGEHLLEGQLRAQINQAERDKDKEAGARLEGLLPLQEALHHGWGIPTPYVCVLLADGDRMGETLRRLTQAKDHRAVSKALARFTQRAREIVETDHLGSLFYAGGDDVLAALSVDQALPCAKALHDTFGEMMADTLKEIGSEGLQSPTLSVGLVIGHVLDPMGDLLTLAREMETVAKEGLRAGNTDKRDGLAIAYAPRSGANVTFYQRWSGSAERAEGDGPTWPGQLYEKDPAELLQILTGWLQEEALSNRSAFHLLAFRRELEGIYGGADSAPTEAMTAEALRILRRKRGDRGDRALSQGVLESLRGYLEWAVVEEARCRPPRPPDRAPLPPGHAPPEEIFGALNRLIHALLIARQLRVSTFERDERTDPEEETP